MTHFARLFPLFSLFFPLVALAQDQPPATLPTTDPTTLPTTFPTTDPTTQPTTGPATQPTPVYSDSDLRLQLANFRGRGSIKVKPGIYTLAGTLTINLPGTYDMTGVELRAHKGAVMWLKGTGIHITGVTFNSDFPADKPSGKNPKVNVQGVIVQATDVWLENATWRNVDYCIQLWPGQRYLTLINPTFTNEVRGDDLYCGGGDENPPRGDVLWVGGSCDSSNQEQNIRASTPGFTGLTCVGVTFRNENSKECFGFRRGHNARLVDCTFWGRFPTFLGEGKPQALEECGNITFERCHFMNGPIDIRFCKDVSVVDCDFHNELTPVTVSTGANVTVKGLRRVLTAPPKKQLFFQDTTPAGGAITDQGGHVMRMVERAVTP